MFLGGGTFGGKSKGGNRKTLAAETIQRKGQGKKKAGEQQHPLSTWSVGRVRKKDWQLNQPLNEREE